MVVARKPIAGTVARNVLEHGTGAINVDGCRVEWGADKPTQAEWNRAGSSGNPGANGYAGQFSAGLKSAYADGKVPVPEGRWPANVILDPEAGAVLDEQAGERGGGFGVRGGSRSLGYGFQAQGEVGYGDSGGPSRFFYCPKASKADRGEGNAHPTVKPHDLMRYLCRLVTPPGGTVLDPFAGSGSTGKACALEGFNFIGIEREPEYAEIARNRIEAAVPPLSRNGVAT